jgi:hypothetical protein
MGEACNMYGGEEKRIQGFGGKLEGKRPLGRPRWKENITMDLQKWDVGAWAGSSWLRTGTGDRYL